MKRVAIFLTQKECDAIAKKPNANGRELEREIMKIIEAYLQAQRGTKGELQE